MHYATCLARVLIVAAILIPRSATADDRYLVRFNAGGAGLTDCSGLVWSDEVRLFNSAATPATVRLLDLSNGGIPPGVATSFDLAAGETASLDAKAQWHPNATGTGAAVPLWITHIDVPPEVIIASHGQLGVGSSCGFGAPTIAATVLGRYPLPVFATLVPSGSSQHHLGVGFGEEDSHINVAVYNAASRSATAHVEVRQSCDNTIIDMRDVLIAPDVLVQLGGFNRGICPYAAGQPLASYDVVVTTDQPSLSFVSTVSNHVPTPVPVTTSGPNLAVP
jgi:hypothetical protein